MASGNPLEQLRRRMQAHATPTAFAALAEEHRRAGRLAEAVAVCREGLERYPAYVSGRVTLGRALLDSGDADAAVIELEHAVAQAPDNLAAARALETARTALGDIPRSPASASAEPSDLPLRGIADTPALPPMDEDAGTIVAPLIVSALGSGPDGPQEFGLAADWSLPALSPPPLPVMPAPAGDDMPPPLPAMPAPVSDDMPPAAYAGHLESSTITADAPAYLQGEDPATIWSVSPEPAEVVADPAAAGNDYFSWSIDPAPSGTDAASADAGADGASDPWTFDHTDTPDTPATAAELTGAWDAPTNEVAVSGPSHLDIASIAAPDDADAPPAAAVDDPSPDDQPSTFWTEPFAGEVADASPSFAGWGEEPPPTAALAVRPPWADEGVVDEAIASCTTPDGPSTTWALGDHDQAAGADPTPFQGSLDDEDTRATPFAGIAEPGSTTVSLQPFELMVTPDQTLEPWAVEVPDEPGTGVPDVTLSQMLDASLAETLDGIPAVSLDIEPPDEARDPVDSFVPDIAQPSLAEAAWTGSVKSALGEVFALAGHGESLEPPAHPSPLVNGAMADVAVQAAIEDATLGDETMPVLASLEQMLAAVRARRAALSGSLDS